MYKIGEWILPRRLFMAESKNKWKGPQPAPRHFGRLLRANFPQITQTGIYNDRNVAGTSKKSSHAEGRALDIHLSAQDPDQKSLGDQLFQAVILRARSIGVHNVIWNRQIWSVEQPRRRIYHGQNPHTDHLHVEFTRQGSQLSQQQMLNAILIEVGTIRTGIEDLQKKLGNLA
jgi:hypothetical protein